MPPKGETTTALTNYFCYKLKDGPDLYLPSARAVSKSSEKHKVISLDSACPLRGKTPTGDSYSQIHCYREKDDASAK